jgi:hypothetical protein
VGSFEKPGFWDDLIKYDIAVPGLVGYRYL